METVSWKVWLRRDVTDYTVSVNTNWIQRGLEVEVQYRVFSRVFADPWPALGQGSA